MTGLHGTQRKRENTVPGAGVEVHGGANCRPYRDWQLSESPVALETLLQVKGRSGAEQHRQSLETNASVAIVDDREYTSPCSVGFCVIASNED